MASEPIVLKGPYPQRNWEEELMILRIDNARPKVRAALNLLEALLTREPGSVGRPRGRKDGYKRA